MLRNLKIKENLHGIEMDYKNIKGILIIKETQIKSIINVLI